MNIKEKINNIKQQNEKDYLILFLYLQCYNKAVKEKDQELKELFLKDICYILDKYNIKYINDLMEC